MQYRDPNTNYVYMIWPRIVSRREKWRVFYKCACHGLRVVPGTVWRDTEQEAEADLVRLAKERGGRRYVDD